MQSVDGVLRRVGSLFERRGNVRLLVTVLVTLFVLGSVALPAQDRFVGRVVDRDGVPQRGCRLAFFDQQNRSNQPDFVLYTDGRGLFYVDNRHYGYFSVDLVLGRLMDRIYDVEIDRRGLYPRTIVVRW